MEPGTQHRIAFEQCFNFRDLGGYQTQGGGTVRWRRLFRSDTPHFMTNDDLRRAREEFGIITVIDLRAPARAQSQMSELSARPATYHHLPLCGDEQEEEFKEKHRRPNAQAVLDMLATAGDSLERIFALLADETTYPAVFHCITGKDRTGLVAALVLGALGVSDDDIVRDYAMSGANMDAWIEHRRKVGGLPADGSFPPDRPRTFFDTPPEVMQSILDAIRDERGSVRQCLVAHGVTPSALRGLEHALLVA